MTDKRPKLAEALVERHRRGQKRFARYQPTTKQAAFHAAGATKRERGNILILIGFPTLPPLT